jgi:hypothetical protein
LLSKEHEIYISKNKKEIPPIRPILFPNEDENLYINFMWPNLKIMKRCGSYQRRKKTVIKRTQNIYFKK